LKEENKEKKEQFVA